MPLQEFMDLAYLISQRSEDCAGWRMLPPMTQHLKLSERIAQIQLRDIRAKSGTDKREAEGLDAAQELLGHRRADMTEHYTRQRRGKLVKPVD